MWSNHTWYFAIHGNDKYSVKLPAQRVIDLLNGKGYLARTGKQSFKGRGMNISCIYTEDGNFGRPGTLENEWCTLLDIRAAKNIPDSLNHYREILSEIAADLDWELVLAEDDDENENVVLYPPAAKPDRETARYIFNYFGELLTSLEWKARMHFFSLEKNPHGSAAREEFFRERGLLSSDPEVLDLLKDGYGNFELKAAERILEQHRDAIFLNNCPQCNKLARTPKAKQCRHCGHSWR